MDNKCVMCDKTIPEGSQVCWKCKARIDKCTICKNKEKGMCLAICDHWRYKKYETKKM